MLWFITIYNYITPISVSNPEKTKKHNPAGFVVPFPGSTSSPSRPRNLWIWIPIPWDRRVVARTTCLDHNVSGRRSLVIFSPFLSEATAKRKVGTFVAQCFFRRSLQQNNKKGSVGQGNNLVGLVRSRYCCNVVIIIYRGLPKAWFTVGKQSIWRVSKNNGTPKSSHFNRVFPYFHHPFWWVKSP